LFLAKYWASHSPARADLSQPGIVLHPSHFISVHTPSPSSVHPLDPHAIVTLMSTTSPINIPLVVVLPTLAAESAPQKLESVTQEPDPTPQETKFCNTFAS
jgi:hypothetical protein